ncbi:VOC family protein [Hyphococcus lacteus]|uniref:VOC family protein n=1 Tax=Hyphococcus lacteus TaxID=3143536 RepID=A0ABV3Z1T6_9PROT
MVQEVTPFLMFEKDAEKAINFYVATFNDAKINHVDYWTKGEAGTESTIKRADFSIGRQNFIALDSPAKHDFTFTPAFSVYIDCSDAAEQENLFSALSTDGAVLMPLRDWGFSQKFAWVNDRFGVSWQLNLPFSDNQN